jgi:hypothetical protein
MPSQNVSFRTSPELLEKIRRRDPDASKYPGATAKREVERWYAMLEDHLADLEKFSPDECVVLIYYVGTYGGRPSHEAVLRAGDVLQGSAVGFLDEFYDRAQISVGAKLRLMNPMSRYALWDAAERYEALALTRAKDGDTTLTFGMALHEIGLHTYDLPSHILQRVEATRAVESDLLPGAYLRAAKEHPFE